MPHADAVGRESPHAGFSTSRPWLPLSPNAVVENVGQQRRDAHSIYHLYRKLIAVRKSQPALQLGSYRSLTAAGDVLLYARELAGSSIFVALNLGAEPTVVSFPRDAVSGTLLLSTYCDREHEPVSGDLALRAHEGAILKLSS